jgi:hypothetical protein
MLHDKKFVEKFQVLNSVTRDKKIDFLDHLVRTAVTDPGLAGVKSVDVAIMAVIRTTEAGVDHRVRGTFIDMAETMPVMSPVFFHWKKIPGRKRKRIKIINDVGPAVIDDLITSSIPQPLMS